MKPKEIQELIDFIANSGLAEVTLETEHLKLSVKKYSQAPAITYEAPNNISQPISQPIPIAAAPTANTPEKAEKQKDAPKDNLITIKSPMIGTFYRSPNPETPSFVNVGDEIKSGQAVCIIEAMKLFNEIESEISGRIVKILVENSSPVEYDQPLFLVEPI